MPKNRQHNRKTKYPDKVTKPKRLVLVRIFLFCSVGIKIQYFPTAPYCDLLYSPNKFTQDWMELPYHSLTSDFSNNCHYT